MREVVPDVYMIEGLRGSNVYLLASKAGLTLVDSGMKGDAGRIMAQLQAGGYALSDLRRIVLTHAHSDHTGNVAELVQHSGAIVLAHREEIVYLEQAKPMPATSTLQRFMNWLSDHTFFRQVPCKMDRALEEGDVVEALGGVQVIHTPGHTPGSICLYESERRILWCGDTLFNKNPMTGKAGLQLSIPLVTWDSAQVKESTRKLSALPAEVLCFGHGEPIMKDGHVRIKELLSHHATQERTR